MIHTKWKIIPGYDNYAISDMGDIVSLNTLKILKKNINPKGYLRVHLPLRRILVHRLVAESFLPIHPAEKTQINHKNGDKTDNRAINLEWVTQSENLLHSYRILGRKAAFEGKHLSPETKNKISNKNKGKKRSKEICLKMSQCRIGKRTLGDNPHSKEVMCLETKETFPCAKSAAIHFGINYSSLTQAIKHKYLVANKYHFTYTQKGQ